MLIAIFSLAFLLFFGFSGNDLEYRMVYLKKPAKEHIQDEARREAVIRSSKQLGKDVKDLQGEVAEHYDDLVTIHCAYESNAVDYDAAGALLKEDYQKMIALVLDARDELKSNMTPEEWREVFREEHQ